MTRSQYNDKIKTSLSKYFQIFYISDIYDDSHYMSAQLLSMHAADVCMVYIYTVLHSPSRYDPKKNNQI